MASPKKFTHFIPELWSNEVIKAYTLGTFADFERKKRSKGAQLLRDAALGHPEYPPPNRIDWRRDYENLAARIADVIWDEPSACHQHTTPGAKK